MTGPTIAVTGLDARVNPYPGLAIARCLRAAPGFNGRIIALTYDVFCTGIYRDDFFDAVYIVPYPSEPERKLMGRLLEIHRMEKLDVIIPALDSEIAVYSRLAKALKAEGIGTLVPSEAAVKARNKDNLFGTCRRLGIRTPRTVVVTHIEQLDETLPGLKYPLVMKGSLAGAHIVRNKKELKIYYLKILETWGFPVLLQERIIGEEFDIAALADRSHNLVAHIPIRKFAVSSQGKASAALVVDDPGLEDMAATLLQRLSWVGPCELELLRESATGRFFLLEVNARFPAWIYLSAAAGYNLPGAAVNLALGRTVPPLNQPAPGHLFFRNRFGHITDVNMLGGLLHTGRYITRSSIAR